jgi:hypothetical protein
MVKKKKLMKQKYLLYIAGVVVALALLNLLIFSGALQQKGAACYRDVCLYGEEDPVAELRALDSSSNKTIIYVEGDVERTQTTAFIDTAFAQLAEMYGLKSMQLIAVGYRNSTALQCYCEEFEDGNFSSCNNNISYCQAVSPQENELMIMLKYPDYQKNEIFVSDRTIEFHARSGADLYAMVLLFKELRR